MGLKNMREVKMYKPIQDDQMLYGDHMFDFMEVN
jgi:hypothetical protein